jgi:hypothetical protein
MRILGRHRTASATGARSFCPARNSRNARKPILPATGSIREQIMQDASLIVFAQHDGITGDLSLKAPHQRLPSTLATNRSHQLFKILVCEFNAHIVPIFEDHRTRLSGPRARTGDLSILRGRESYGITDCEYV